jgi:hypothetical protein
MNLYGLVRIESFNLDSLIKALLSQPGALNEHLRLKDYILYKNSNYLIGIRLNKVYFPIISTKVREIDCKLDSRNILSSLY